jgi:Mg/Co/Ni transporter MgtE
MREQVNTKLLQSQTGHKTLEMLDHYAGHEIAGDVEKIQTAQRETFGRLLPERIELGVARQERDTQGRFASWRTAQE